MRVEIDEIKEKVHFDMGRPHEMAMMNQGIFQSETERERTSENSK